MENPKNLYDLAVRWLYLGTVPIPLMYRSKTPKIRWQEYQSRYPTDMELRSWFSSKLTNMAVITGWIGLTVIDFDDMDVFFTWCDMFGMPDTYMVKTGRGVHAYYNIKEPPPTMSLGKIDIKGRWGYVLVPPSIHPSGAQYENFYMPPSKHITKVDHITDIVPESMLPRVVETSPKPATLYTTDDPLEAAMNPAVRSGNGIVADVKARYRIEDMFPDRHRTSADGRFWIARCPFHNDHNPSFWIDTVEQRGGCYAKCIEKSVDVINVYAKMQGITNDDALYILAGSGTILNNLGNKE